MKPVVAVVLSAMLLAGCGNAVTADVNGATAITVDDQGNPVVLVAVCHSTIDRVEISADREGLKETEENKLLGTWTADKPMKGLISLSLTDPGGDWTTAPTFVPEDGKGYIVIGSQAKADVEATQVFFHGSDLSTLTPDKVIIEDANVQERTTFEKSCDDD